MCFLDVFICLCFHCAQIVGKNVLWSRMMFFEVSFHSFSRLFLPFVHRCALNGKGEESFKRVIHLVNRLINIWSVTDCESF